MIVKHKNVLGLFFGILFFLAAFNFFSARASAATISVGSACTLPAAMNNANADDQSGSASCAAGSGADAITIPAGNITLTSDLPPITSSLSITGAGINDTNIEGAGFRGFYANLVSPNPKTKDITIQKMSLSDMADYAVETYHAKSVTLDLLDISNSHLGVRIVSSITANVSNSTVHDNTDSSVAYNNDPNSGVEIGLKGLVAGDTPTFTMTNVKILRNESLQTSGVVVYNDDTAESNSGVKTSGAKVIIRNSFISANMAPLSTGLRVVQGEGPVATVPIELTVDSTTISNNITTVTTPEVLGFNEAYVPVVSGIFLTGNLADQQNFTNVTVAYNTVNNPAPDNRRSLAGFFGSLAEVGSSMRITNTTVVGNSVTQPATAFVFPAFASIRVTLDFSNYPTIGFVSVVNGASAENLLVAQNISNGYSNNCRNALDLNAMVGATGTLDGTPTNLGHNISDDQKCTGYTYIANLYDTIEHEVKYNGGPVPTIALLPGSPATSAGGQVLGVSTDARGVAREGYYSVGACQGVLAASTTTAASAGGGTLAVTGIKAISAGILGLLLVGSLALVYADYRRHKKPLMAIDSNVSYTFMHHIRVVTVPLFKYRLSIKISKVNPLKKEGVHRF